MRPNMTARSCAALVLIPAALLFAWRPAAGADHTVAVALFYAPTPVTTYSGLTPEEYASEGLSARLAAGSAGRFAVVSRDRVRADEGGLRWREWDALRFARLGELARAAGADTVVVGWIDSLVVEHLGGGRTGLDMGGDGGGVMSATAVITVQTFDASQGRIVYQTKVAGHALGAAAVYVLERALDDAVSRAAAQLPATFASGAPQPL